MLEIARGVKSMGARMITYIPAGVGATPEAVKKAFDWKKEKGAPMDEAQRRFTAFIAEYSGRFGRLLDGWWFDGVYPDHPMRQDLPVYEKLWLDAARAGNPNAAVALSRGFLS